MCTNDAKILRRERTRILVVEDQTRSRELLIDMLAVLNHEAHGAETAEEAGALLDKGNYDILIADIELPGMSGTMLAREAKSKYPKLKIIFASGYGMISDTSLGFPSVLLSKPYGLVELEEALATAQK